MDKKYLISNLLVLAIFTILSIAFHHWWIIFFSTIFMYVIKDEDN